MFAICADVMLVGMHTVLYSENSRGCIGRSNGIYIMFVTNLEYGWSCREMNCDKTSAYVACIVLYSISTEYTPSAQVRVFFFLHCWVSALEHHWIEYHKSIHTRICVHAIFISNEAAAFTYAYRSFARFNSKTSNMCLCVCAFHWCILYSWGVLACVSWSALKT